MGASGAQSLAVIGFGVLAFIVIGIWVYVATHLAKAEEERKAKIFNYCMKRGWEWKEPLVSVWYGMGAQPLRRGVHKDYMEVWPMSQYSQAKLRVHVIGEIEGIPMEAFELSYVVSNGKSSTTYYYTVMGIVEKTPVGWFELMEMGFGDYVSKMFGGQDITVGDEVFDERFRIKGNEILAVKELFHEGTQILCMRQGALRLAGSGDRFMVIRKGRMEAQDLEEMADFLHRFWDEIPERWRKNVDRVHQSRLPRVGDVIETEDNA